MKYLLDTHILIWFISGDEQLSLYAKELIENEDNELLVGRDFSDSLRPPPLP
ncbi:type II toxin-antitoxin system VapC family toxin [Planktothrix rubescens]|uniref:type II toxin-antitoxin system VapC family toxin n=1 Tax=Planktothrix rubescens TaxID=59512 RepID=UPI0003F4B3F2|nr:type II toxin-antitoxin system VapC family toxin [Planktothrix rubescens]